jgi:glycosyltransferase involved in cell wall biosynthesis
MPSFNGVQRLKPWLPELLQAFEDLSTRGFLVEWCLVDDGSRPEDAEALGSLLAGLAGQLAATPRLATSLSVRLVRLPENQGQVLATLVGVSLAKGDYLITIDDDGSHPPGSLPGLLDCLPGRPALELVYAWPEAGSDSGPDRPWIRRLGTFANNWLFRQCLGLPEGIAVGSYRIFKRSLLQKALSVPVSYPYLSAMLLRAGRGNPEGWVGSYCYAVPGRIMQSQGQSRHRLAGLFTIYSRLFFFWGPGHSLGKRLRPPRQFSVDDFVYQVSDFTYRRDES